MLGAVVPHHGAADACGEDEIDRPPAHWRRSSLAASAGSGSFAMPIMMGAAISMVIAVTVKLS
jgi:hypothetical protein